MNILLMNMKFQKIFLALILLSSCAIAKSSQQIHPWEK